MSDYFDTGFVARVPAWHGKARVTDRAAESWDEAREWADLTWEPIKVPSYAFSGIDEQGQTVHEPGENVVGDYFVEPDHARVVRSDTGALLDIAQSSYTLITHREMGEIIDALREGGLTIETAGATHGGKRVWALCLLDEPITIRTPDGGRTDISLTLPYMPLMNAHDGSGACRVGYCQTRIVCANTWRSSEAEQDGHGRTFVFRHTANWRDRVEEAKAALAGQRDAIADYSEQMGELLGIRVTEAQRELFIAEFVPMPPAGLISDRVIANVDKAREQIREILASDTTAAVADSAYGLVMAATEYLDHVRAFRSRDSLLGRQLLRPEPLKFKAARLAREVAAV